MYTFILPISIFLIFQYAYADPKQIKSDFQSYKFAIVNNDGLTASEYVLDNIFDHYTGLINSALYKNKQELFATSFYDIFMVLRLRYEFNVQRLSKMSGRELYIYAINNGWIGKDGILSTTLGESYIDNLMARVNLIIKGQKTPYYYTFQFIDDKWKLDVKHALPMLDKAFKNTAKKMQIPETQLVSQIFNHITSEQLTAKYWMPMAGR